MKTDHFEQLYRGNYARLYYYAFRFVADEEACRDIVNDVFEQAWKDREQLQEATAVACLYTRTRNRCIDYLAMLIQKYGKEVLDEISEKENESQQ